MERCALYRFLRGLTQAQRSFSRALLFDGLQGIFVDSLVELLGVLVLVLCNEFVLWSERCGS